MKKIEINQNDVDQRIDNLLIKIFPKLNKVLVYKALRNKQIKVNRKKVEHNYRVQLNDVIEIYLNDDLLVKEVQSSFKNAKDELVVVYEDNNVIVVNKPIDLMVHEDNENSTNDTLINRIKKYLYNKGEWNPEIENHFTPALGHRLDRNTSGLLITAKNAIALKSLQHAFKHHEVKKNYLALITGILENDQPYSIKLYLEDLENGFVSVYDTIKPNAKEAITKFRIIRHISNKYSLVDVQLITGRKHQIRASFNWLGFPIVGEQKYISKHHDKDKRFRNQCLVSYKLQMDIKDKEDPLFYLNKKIFQLPESSIWFLKKLEK